MVIDNVSLYGLTTLYDIVCDIYESKEITGKSFGRNLIEIYNQVAIKIKIKSLSLIEYFHLKYILQEGNCGKFFPHGESYNMSYIKQVFPEISHTFRLMSRAMHDANFSEEDKILYSPAGFMDGECEVTVTGSDLTMFFKTDPMIDFFLKIADDAQFQNPDHTFNRPYMYELVKDGLITDTSLETSINTKFMEVFYKSVLQNHDYVDLLSDFSISNHYFYNNNKLINVNNLVNVEKDPKGLTQVIKRIKKDKDINLRDDVYLSFSLFTDFYTFLQYYIRFPKHCFTAIESLRSPFNCTKDLFEEPSTYVEEMMNQLKTDIARYYGENDKALNMAYLIFNYAPMHFVLKITFRDAERYLIKFRDENNFSSTKESIEFMVNFVMNLYGLMKHE